MSHVFDEGDDKERFIAECIRRIEDRCKVYGKNIGADALAVAEILAGYIYDAMFKAD